MSALRQVAWDVADLEKTPGPVGDGTSMPLLFHLQWLVRPLATQVQPLGSLAKRGHGGGALRVRDSNAKHAGLGCHRLLSGSDGGPCSRPD